jgi:hypothetical protein
MSIEIISGETAWATLRNNPDGRWPTRQNPQRLYPAAAPKAQVGFRFEAQEKLFCIGSCFAREIERTLDQLGFEVLSISRNLPTSPRRTVHDSGMFNKYNVASIRNELRWALDENTPYSHHSLIQAPGGLVQDYQLAGQNYADDIKSAQTFREAFNQSFQAIKHADVVVMTLGLSEVWFDKHTQLYLNVAPSESLVAMCPQRFEVHILDYAETLAILDEIYTLLKNHLTANFRLLLTVSPVPLLATFRVQDVLVANSYSKSVLRAAVEQFLIDKTNISYFPSYETVSLSHPNTVWRDDDFRHVDAAFVDYIVNAAIGQFNPSIHQTELHTAMAKAKVLYHGQFLADALACLKPYMTAQTYLAHPQVFVLARAIQGQLSGKAKQIVLRGLTYGHPKNWPLLASLLIKRYFRRTTKSPTNPYLGYLDDWNGHQLSGWGINRNSKKPIRLQIFFENQLVDEILADQTRTDVAEIYGADYLNCGFCVSLKLSNAEGCSVRVVFADTAQDLKNSPFWAQTASPSQFLSG